MADGLVGQYGVLAGVKPFFQDVLVERNPHVVLEDVGDMVFAHRKKDDRLSRLKSSSRCRLI